jgi:hypothetical protein
MHLSNGALKEIAAKHTTFTITPTTKSAASSIVESSARVLNAMQPGSSDISAHFAYTSSIPLLFVVGEDLVFVEALTDFHSRNQKNRKLMTLSGGNDAAFAQLTLGASFSNGRQIPSLFSRDGIQTVPGLVNFESAVPSALSVDSTHGVVTLKGNHYEAVQIKATTCGSDETATNKVGATTLLSPNLQPVSVGDVDLGSRTGAAIPMQSVGAIFSVLVRLNTGALFLRSKKCQFHQI